MSDHHHCPTCGAELPDPDDRSGGDVLRDRALLRLLEERLHRRRRRVEL